MKATDSFTSIGRDENGKNTATKNGAIVGGALGGIVATKRLADGVVNATKEATKSKPWYKSSEKFAKTKKLKSAAKLGGGVRGAIGSLVVGTGLGAVAGHLYENN